jgi:hypothetical protein
MPLDRIVPQTADCADFAYLLGLDRLPEEEIRNPRAIWGDPRLCALLEASSRFKSRSTNLILCFEEWLSDQSLLEVSREYVEECLLKGVPTSDYAYAVIVHDEPCDKASPIKSGRKRSAAHIKIINMRLPSGGFLQPFYPKRDRMLTTLFLADKCIKNGWSFPLDPGRLRAVSTYRKVTKVTQAKSYIDSVVKAAPREANGKPDPLAILMNLHAIGLRGIEAVKGPLGRPGVRFRLSDHPKPLRFFGPDYAALNHSIQKDNERTNKHRKPDQIRKGEDFFPLGELIRTPEYAKRIASSLKQWLGRRAILHTKRYGLNRPPLVLGAEGLGGRSHPLPSCGVRDSMARQRQPQPQVAAGTQRGNFAHAWDTGSTEAVNSPAEYDSNSAPPKPTEEPETALSNGNTTTDTATGEKRNPEPCGTQQDLGTSPESILAAFAGAIRAFHRGLEGVRSGIRARLEGRSQFALDVEEANRGFDRQGRSLDEALQRISREIAQVGSPEVEDDWDPLGGGEYLIRLQKAERLDKELIELEEEKEKSHEIEF